MSSPDNSAIRISHLSKMFKVYHKPSDMFWELVTSKPRYKPFWALQDISFDVKRGQVVGLIGRNGAGKSTLLKIITGTLDKTSGEVQVNGRVSSILELGTGFNGEYSGRENIFLGGLMIGLSREEIKEKEDWIIEFSELRDFIDQPFKTYSTGMQARLTFSTAVCIDPDILIIDEALSVGDAKFSRKCFGKIDEFRNSGRTILLVSHDTNTISTFCDSAILLEHGRIFDQGEPQHISKVYYKMLFASDERQARAIPLAQLPAEIALDTTQTTQELGYGWRLNLANSPVDGDSIDSPQQSPYVLYEDDKPLGPAHSAHDQIRAVGGGSFSHWGRELFFSTSDNSDPRVNNRAYILRREQKESQIVQTVPVDASLAGLDLHKTADRDTMRQIALQKLKRQAMGDQRSSRQIHMGNGKGEILDFGIRDEAGNSVALLTSGARYQFFMRMLFYEDVAGAAVGFLIRDVKGVDLFGTGSLAQRLPLTPQRRGDLVEYELEVTMWLTNGIYFLTMGVADPFAESNVQYDLLYDAIQFEVRAKKDLFQASIVDLDAQIISTQSLN